MKNMFKHGLGVALLAVTVFIGDRADAVPIVFQGDLTDGTLHYGASANNGLSSPSGWDFWTFTASAGDVVTVTNRRNEYYLDPIMGVWFGLESDTSAFSSLYSSTANAISIGGADDTLGNTFGGPYGDPQLIFTAAYTGLYMVATADHTAGSYNCSGPCDYTLQVTGASAVPEPASLALFGAGLIGLGWTRRRKAVA
ncbi:conserved protein of unknown function [Magnetospira sp. QH-2]|nr:PEP-CTERM sorting domain-containing protein [Magnetospira sp. QH-2]CCQ73005.1 conserved protein of unknown function [Magnetospira sp. QH-2]